MPGDALVSVEHHTDQVRPFRSLEFWSRACSIWVGYKAAQAQAAWLRFKGHSEDYIKEHHWSPHADRSGRSMHALCVDLRGFFIKVRIACSDLSDCAATCDRSPAEIACATSPLQDRSGTCIRRSLTRFVSRYHNVQGRRKPTSQACVHTLQPPPCPPIAGRSILRRTQRLCPRGDLCLAAQALR
jgi:hypothetical protein